MRVSRGPEMRNMDLDAGRKFGLSEELLMENAGCAAFSAIQKELDIAGRSFLVLCGTGNNGGDGFVLARKLLSAGGRISILLFGSPAKLSGVTKRNYDLAAGVSIPIAEAKSTESVAGELGGCDTIIDAIFGTGLSRSVTGIHAAVIDLVNASGKPIFSLDIPSGVNGDTGAVMGTAIRADYTVTFGLPKTGNLLYPGYGYCGKLYLSHISFPPELYEQEVCSIEINEPAILPERNPEAHKGDFGDVLFIAGSSGYYGAPYFCAMSFLKAGGGYSRLAAPRSIVPFIASKGSEIVFLPQTETAAGSIAKQNFRSLVEYSERADLVVLGPGLSLDRETQELVRRLVKEIGKPLIIDGDGITSLEKNLECVGQRKAPTIFTPHVGEMARLSGVSMAEIKTDRLDILRERAEKLKSIIVLKGAHSLIGYPNGKTYINMSGNAGMATAGSGDVLTGVIAAMFGLGLTIEEAVRTGVFIHGLAGDLAARRLGEDGITAQDILEYLPYALKNYREKRDRILARAYQSLSPV